jgi:hypothetical protein
MFTMLEGMCWRRLLPGLVLFKLLVSLLQLGVVGAYMVQGV